MGPFANAILQAYRCVVTRASSQASCISCAMCSRRIAESYTKAKCCGSNICGGCSPRWSRGQSCACCGYRPR